MNNPAIYIFFHSNQVHIKVKQPHRCIHARLECESIYELRGKTHIVVFPQSLVL